MRFVKSMLLVTVGMVVALGISGVVPGVARATPDAAAQQITAMPTPLPPNVIVTNEPTVNAKQAGAWTVRLQDREPLAVAPVHVAAPGFLQSGARYAFFWTPDVKADVETVVTVGPDGWVLVAGHAGEDGATWINTARAIRIEQVGR